MSELTVKNIELHIFDSSNNNQETGKHGYLVSFGDGTSRFILGERVKAIVDSDTDQVRIVMSSGIA